MRAGWRHGHKTCAHGPMVEKCMERRAEWGRMAPGRGVSPFLDGEGGYTSVACAVALLVSISLVFTVAAVEWSISRSADVQPLADACAMAGQNTVAAYYTTAQVLDASVLSMGLAGMAVMGVGLVTAAIPGAQTVSSQAVEAGSDILDARQKFARQVASGLQKVEKAIPFAIVANSASCVAANAQRGSSLVGVAIPFPLESQSDFSSLDSLVSGDDIGDNAERLQDATRRAEDAKARADSVRERAWRADCVDEPSCLRSRAASLAGLSDSENYYAPTPESWNFGLPISRSRIYYLRRLMQEAPQAPDIESVTDSCARSAFYEYAIGEVNAAWYYESPDGHVSMNIPHLARNSDEMRGTWLYGDARWPCTDEEGGRTLHSCWGCPAATGPDAGLDSVAAVEVGAVRHCDVCRMDVGDLGKVASISTSATNGYEHYWQIIVEAAQEYEQARNEQADAEQEMRSVAEEGRSAFQRALEQLSVPRPRICPPGAWGCVSVVCRSAGTTVPTELTEAFISNSELPAGAAVSAAALAPDDATNGNDILSHFFDGIGAANIGGTSVFGDVTGLWGRLLVAYGNKYQGMGNSVEGFFGRMDGIFGGTVGSWLRERLAGLMSALGLQPADMRMRKPVLVHTGKVLGRAGLEPTGRVRSMVQALPSGGTPLELAHALGCWIWDEREGHAFTIAEIPIPGTNVGIPLTVDLTGM